MVHDECHTQGLLRFRVASLGDAFVYNSEDCISSECYALQWLFYHRNLLSGLLIMSLLRSYFNSTPIALTSGKPSHFANCTFVDCSRYTTHRILHIVKDHLFGPGPRWSRRHQEALVDSRES